MYRVKIKLSRETKGRKNRVRFPRGGIKYFANWDSASEYCVKAGYNLKHIKIM